MKIIRLTTILLALVAEDRANKTCNTLMSFVLKFAEYCLKYDAIHDFSVWLRSGSNPDFEVILKF